MDNYIYIYIYTSVFFKNISKHFSINALFLFLNKKNNSFAQMTALRKIHTTENSVTYE